MYNFKCSALFTLLAACLSVQICASSLDDNYARSIMKRGDEATELAQNSYDAPQLQFENLVGDTLTADEQMPARCNDTCKVFNIMSDRCASKKGDELVKCVCNVKNFISLSNCALCAPEYYDIYENGLKGFVDNALAQCKAAGKPVEFDTSSLPGTAKVDTSSVEEAPSEDASSGESTSGSAEANTDTNSQNQEADNTRPSNGPIAPFAAGKPVAGVVSNSNSTTSVRMGGNSFHIGASSARYLLSATALVLPASIAIMLL